MSEKEQIQTPVEAVERGGVTYSPVGLQLRDGMTFEEWDSIGDQIAVMHQASPWWIGDWYLAGDRLFGEAASQARAISDKAAAHGRQLSPATVIDYSSLCRRFPLEARIAELSFTHHAVVRALPDERAQQLLTQAKEEGFSVAALKRALNEASAGAEPKPVVVRNADAYDVIMADPPWKYSNSGVRGAAAKHYATMEAADIEAYLVSQSIATAENAALFLWATNPLLPVALKVMEAWGFEYKSNVCWRKMRNGKLMFGSGWYVRGCHELILIGIRGSFLPAVKNERSLFDGEVLEHSRKPYEAYEMIERMYPEARRLELFARHERHGWDRMGLEAPPAGGAK